MCDKSPTDIVNRIDRKRFINFSYVPKMYCSYCVKQYNL